MMSNCDAVTSSRKQESGRNGKLPGRPKLLGDDATKIIGARLSVGLLKDIDTWRKAQPGSPVTRSEALRVFAVEAIKSGVTLTDDGKA